MKLRHTKHALLLTILLPLSVANASNESEPLAEPKAVEPIPPFSPHALERARHRLRHRHLGGELLFNYFHNLQRYIPPLIAELEKVAPNSAEIHFFRAIDYYREGERARASHALHDALTADPEFDRAWNLKGMILMEANQLPAAIDALQRAVNYSPYTPIFNYNLAYAHFRLGDYPTARRIIERAIWIRPNLSEAHLLYGRILSAQGEHLYASEAFRSAHQYGQRGADFFVEYHRAAHAANNERLTLELSEESSIANLAEVRRTHAAIRFRYGEFRRAEEILWPLIRSEEASREDFELYLRALHQRGGELGRRLQQPHLDAEARNWLEEYWQSLGEKPDAPEVRDPILRRAR